MVMIQRTVLIQRDEKGFGLRVSGENPVFVESVKSGGSAWRAGVRSGDGIIKVNGTLVTNYNHQEVVQMIQTCGEKVLLTLEGFSNQSPNSTLTSLHNSSGQSTLIQNDTINNLPLNLAYSTSTRIKPINNNSNNCPNNSQLNITPPLPANDSTLIEFEKTRIETIKKMLGDEREFLNKLRRDGKYLNDKETEINATLNRIRTLKWAFEIYSTFLFNDSPLRLNFDFIKDQQQFYELLNENFTSATILVNTIFDPYLEKCKEIINGQIEQFKTNLPLANGIGTMKKVQASTIVECLTNELIDLPHQISLNASASSTLLTQITILVSYLLNNSTVSNSSIQSIAQLTCFTSILYHCFPHLLVSSDENANTLAKLIPVPVYLSFHQANTSHSNHLHKRQKSLPASSSNNQNSSAIPYHLSSSSNPTGNHNPPLSNSVISLQPKTLAHSANNQIYLKNGHVFNLLNTFKLNNCSGCSQSIWAMFGWYCKFCQLSAHHWCLRSTADEHYCPGHNELTLDQCNDLNQNNINNLHHLSTRYKSKNKSTGGRLLENILKNRAESLKHKKEDQNAKCCRKKSDTSIGSTSLFSDYSSKMKFTSYSSSSSDSDVDDYQFTNQSSEHSYSIFNDNTFNRDDQILIDSNNDAKHTLSSNSSFLVSRGAATMPLSNERRKANKRQEIFNELISTEKTHVNNLEILHEIFYKPIYAEQLLTPECIDCLFSNHSKLYEIHSQIYQLLRKRKKEIKKSMNDAKSSQQFGIVQFPLDHGLGQTLVQIFEGEIGTHLEEAASVFCAKQTIGGEMLRNKLKKDSKLTSFLQEAEANKCCRRLQLKDMLASCFQRITKYPLLMENLMKETPDKESDEYKLIERACKRSKSILCKVNECVKQSENKQKLFEIQRKIDKPNSEPLANFDLTQKTLIYEGQLTFRVVKKSFEVLVLLCTDVLIFLSKEGEKYTLKSINKNTHPIVQIKNVITRKNATDSRGFDLISKQENLMYEFVAASETEKNNWVKQIDEAAVKSGGGVRSAQLKLRDLTSRDEQFKDDQHEQIITKLMKDQDLLGSKTDSQEDRSEQPKDEISISKLIDCGNTIKNVTEEEVNLNYNRKFLHTYQPMTDQEYSLTLRGQNIIERIQAIETEIERLNNEKQQLLRELNEECEDRG